MEFRIHRPSASLQPFIQCYLEADARTDLRTMQYALFPNGYSGIFFNFGNRGKIIVKEEHETPAVSVFGQIDRHFLAEHSPGFYSIGVLVKPTVLATILRVNMIEFTNAAFDGALIRKDFAALHHQLEELTTFVEKIALIEKFMYSATRDISAQPTFVTRAIRALEMPVYTPIKKIATELGISERYLETQFNHAVGLSPKTYSLIVRFKRMEQQMQKLSAVRWRDMTFAHEYHDQNHFIKDFKRFTGHTPTQYLLRRFEMGSAYLKA